MVIKMKNNKIKTSFGSIEGTKAWTNKTGIEFVISVLIYLENCL